MRVPSAVLAVAGLLLLTAPPPLAAQQADPDRIRVFFDCQTACDQSHVRAELDWVDWVRDRTDAGVHILVTGQGTGGGGLQYTLAFIGLGPFQGVDDEVVFATSGDATNNDRREALVGALSLGLARYVVRTPGRLRLRVRRMGGGPGGPGGPGGGEGQASPGDDPWDFWVFNLGVNGFLDGESSTRSMNTSGSFSANRTTEAWKIDLRVRFSEQYSRYELPDTVVESTIKNWSTNALLVKSMGARWSLGLRAGVGSSSYTNQDSYWTVQPGVEFNLFPYSESTRRELTLQYTVGPNHYDYTAETIYSWLSETRWSHTLALGLDVTQPWGQADIGINGTQYLHDTDFYSLSVFASANVRLFRGFSLRITGSYSRVRDQLYIPAGDLSDEEILLRQQALQTDYRYFTSFGISYRFGSIFNNVVNPRFGGSNFFF